MPRPPSPSPRRTGFTGTVGLSLVAGQDGVPQGLSLSPQSLQVTGSSPVSQALTLTASAGTPAGTYRIKVRGTGQNITRDVDLTVTVSPPPDFTLSLSPNALTVQQGNSGTTTLTLTPQEGFTGTVSLDLVDGNGNPVPGITLSPQSVTVSGGGPVTQALTVSVASSVSPGTYNLQVRGTSGSLTREAGLGLTVSAAGGGGGGGGGASGATWTLRSLGAPLYGVTHGNGLFVAVGVGAPSSPPRTG